MKRCGLVAVVGVPNAGKSTLVNALVGEKISIVTPKPQTTRFRIRGVCMQGEVQLVLVDTPGIFVAHKPFEQAMVESAWQSLREADALLVVVDAQRGIEPGTRAILQRIMKMTQRNKAFAALNKIDTIPKARLLELAAELSGYGEIEEIFMVSALKHDGLKPMLKSLSAIMPEGPWLFDAESATDLSMRMMAAELTREQAFMALQQELPYALHVATEHWEEQEKKIIIHQSLIVSREAHKKIILGKGGMMIKQIGMRARAQIKKALGKGIELRLFIKVRKDWKQQAEIYRELGLDEFKR